MSTEDNKVLTRRVMEEGINQRNQAIFDELFAPGFVWHTTSTTLHGREAASAFLSLFFTGVDSMIPAAPGHFNLGAFAGTRGELQIQVTQIP